jgi:hypothetical protein
MFGVIAFIGLPWPTNTAGIGDEAAEGIPRLSQNSRPASAMIDACAPPLGSRSSGSP